MVSLSVDFGPNLLGIDDQASRSQGDIASVTLGIPFNVASKYSPPGVAAPEDLDTMPSIAKSSHNHLALPVIVWT
jgi:hypothetical protein